MTVIQYTAHRKQWGGAGDLGIHIFTVVSFYFELSSKLPGKKAFKT